MRWFFLTLIGASLSFLSACNKPAPKDGVNPAHEAVWKKPRTPVEIRLQPVSASSLGEHLGKHKGKVVVVDVWALRCRPCREGFHHLVELNGKYDDSEVVCASICLPGRDPNEKEASLNFLKGENAAFENFWLEDPTPWLEKIGIPTIPAVLVFGKDGTLARKFIQQDPSGFYSKIEAFVNDLLKS